MTKLLEKAFEKARLLPAEQQDEAAKILLTVIEQDAPRLTDEQVEEVRRRRAERSYASDEEVAAFFRHASA